MPDTLAMAEKLENSGFTPEQARGLVRVLNGQATGRLVTKHDLKGFERELTLRIGAMLVAVVAAITMLDRLLT